MISLGKPKFRLGWNPGGTAVIKVQRGFMTLQLKAREVCVAKKKNGAKKAEGEMAAVKDVFAALEPLNPIQRGRVLASVQALFEIPRAGLLEKAAEDAEAKQTDGRAKSRSTSGRKPKNLRKPTNRRKSPAGAQSRKSAGRKKATSRS